MSGTVAKKLFEQTAIDVNGLVTVRLLIAGILLLTIQFWLKDRSQIVGVWRDRRTALRLIVFGLVGMLSVQYTYMASIQHGNAAVATLLQCLAPVMVIRCLIRRSLGVLHLVCRPATEAIRFPRHCRLGDDHRRFGIKCDPSTMAHRLYRLDHRCLSVLSFRGPFRHDDRFLVLY